ncbi:hypothetical protein B0H99_10234 [Planomicrobium soli]|uniref:Uncharacterized protein n=1 Tax=Planomicrobium soli TaxID=1176648 RepID=A0A2P8H552_9BACL|nr:hypothetical protein B0H99_10234 [Planomicrobium soli]
MWLALSQKFSRNKTSETRFLYRKRVLKLPKKFYSILDWKLRSRLLFRQTAPLASGSRRTNSGLTPKWISALRYPDGVSAV